MHVELAAKLLKDIVSVIDPYVQDAARFRFDEGLEILVADYSLTTMARVFVPMESFVAYEVSHQIHWLPIAKLKEVVRAFGTKDIITISVEGGIMTLKTGRLKRTFPVMGAATGPTNMPSVRGNNTLTVPLERVRSAVKMIETVKDEVEFLYDGRLLIFAEDGGDAAVSLIPEEEIIYTDVPDGEFHAKYDPEFLGYALKPISKDVDDITLVIGNDLPIYLEYNTEYMNVTAVVAPRRM